MAGSIKGITLKIGGDTTSLERSLKSVDKSIRTTQSDLRDVNRLLKFDPKNTELLKQKQELLGKAVKDTSDRLQTLKDAQKQMEDAGVDKSSEEYRGLQREIIATEQKLKNLKKQQQDFGSVSAQVLKAAGKEVEAFGGKIQSVGDDLTKKITAPLSAVGAASLAAFGEVDKGLDIVAKKTGATGENLETLNAQAMEIAKSLPTSFETAGEAIGEVNTRFGLTGDALTDLSAQFVKFADINDTDVTSSVDGVQKAMAAYGLRAEEASGFLDALTRVAQNTGVSVDKLESGLVSNATAFQEMGLSAEQAAAFMGQMEKSGANSETVMNGLRKALKSATADGKDMNTALAEMQDAILNGTESMDGLTAAYDLFGKSGDQIYGAIQNGTLDFTKLGDAALDAGGAVSETFEATKSPMENFQTVLNRFLELGYEIGNAIMPAIQKAMDAIVPVIEKLVGWWESLDENAQGFIVTAALVVASIGPIISIVGTVTSVIGGVIGAIGSVTGVISTVVGVIGGPLTIAIGAAVALGVALWKNWDTVKQKAGELFAAVKEKFDAIKNAISNAINAARDAVKNAIDRIKGFFNFDFKWPKLKMPHFTFSGTMNPLEWATKGTPKIGVEWYRKAAATPYYFNSPSIIGVGDVPEVVIGADTFRRMTSSGGTTINAPITIIQQPGQDSRALSRAVINELRLTLNREGRGL